VSDEPPQAAQSRWSGPDPLAGRSLPFLAGLGLIAGLLGGGGAVLFRDAFTLLNHLLYGIELELNASLTARLPWWQVPLTLTIGGLIVGLFVRYFLPGQRPHGVVDVIEAATRGQSRLPLWLGLKTAAASVLTLGFGASVGREAPVVHLGASLGSSLADRFDLNWAARRLILGGAVAAAVAASFNATLAGTLFALELVVRRYAFTAFGPVALAAAMGTLIAFLRYGADPAFVIPEDWRIVSLAEIPAFFVLGLLAAGLAILFMRGIFWVDAGFRFCRVPRWLRPAIAGLIVGLLALISPEIIGVGYEATSKALRGEFGLLLLTQILVLKLIATCLSVGSGFVGGVFSPALVLGALMGSIFALLSALVFPFGITDEGAYALVGMGAVAGVVLGAPVSTLVMVVELTGGFAITFAVSVATVTAAIVANQLGVRSFFQQQLTIVQSTRKQAEQPPHSAKT